MAGYAALLFANDSRSHRIFVFNSINFLWFHKSFMCIALFSLVSIENHNKLLRRSWKVFLSLLGFFHTHSSLAVRGGFLVYIDCKCLYINRTNLGSFSLYILYETFNIPINAALIPLLNAKASLSLGVLHTYISPIKAHINNARHRSFDGWNRCWVLSAEVFPNIKRKSNRQS